MTDGSVPKHISNRTRPAFPARAVVTAGMPYGNKDLHFGHVGGVFIHADAFARFLRDRIGTENVIFVSGTDCYGSPIVADYAKRVEAGEFSGTLQEFVEANHRSQKQTLASYHVELNEFAASAMEPYRRIHQDLGSWILRTLRAHGHLDRMTTPQFYDDQAGTFLNGRQVIGRCPISGCKSEKAYADECSLGHQYEPRDLIAPKSTLTGQTPTMRDVTNWYVPLRDFDGPIRGWLEGLLQGGVWREFAVRALLEHFEPPTLHVKRELVEKLETVRAQLPAHRQEEGQAKSVRLVFERLEDLEQARGVLGREGIQYRSGKTLVPFRMTGNLAWGLPAPEIDSLAGLTFWVWPESLWAPISFSAAYLERTGQGKDRWTDWWCSKEAKVYQFIGEDNIYFYGLAEMGIWLGMQGAEVTIDPPPGQLQPPHLVVNRHLLFLDKKASSSGEIKPPMARDLLTHYTSDQLRTHFLALGLGMRNISFRPKPLDPKADPRSADPVLKEGNLLSNALNRAVRSCFYTVQKFYDGKIPAGEVSPDVGAACEAAILDFEDAFFRHEFHGGVTAVSELIRDINARWTAINPYRDDCEEPIRRQMLIDAFAMVRTAVVLLHPVAPEGTEKVRQYLRVGEEFWSWKRIFEPLYTFMDNPAEHRLEPLPPKVDFFEKPPSQVS